MVINNISNFNVESLETEDGEIIDAEDVSKPVSKDHYTSSLHNSTTDPNNKDQPNTTNKRTSAGKKKKKKSKKRRNKEIPSQRSSTKKKYLCKFYREGRCWMGDNCIYEHVGDLIKKLEPCKFYVRDGICMKGENCVYMHKDFPCKFFYWGNCNKTTNCLFSHDVLNEKTQQILMDHLNTIKKPDKPIDNQTYSDLTIKQTIDEQMVKENVSNINQFALSFYNKGQ